MTIVKDSTSLTIVELLTVIFSDGQKLTKKLLTNSLTTF